ncbi:response regulator transcription factor [Paenibacillus sp.]|jgi:DNA-binding response OmpR family regulator|uniref:response regulator transcription factor n=1 Tax=Paenibacillus sp. TaxID=58172 RepID=UPI0028272B08|nr:response regulator transcription factor [Paenibacillus sp.]MDR0270900.1 response regulator transcription factor [Paenibacillus sp.]
MQDKILIVDDEAEIISLIEQAMTAEGYRVYTASDGTKAMDLLSQSPDLIILDVMMPGINGFELCQMIRDEVDCPILFVSARQTEADRIQGLSIGGDDYITKPFSLRELKARVAAHLRGSRRIRESSAERSLLRYGVLRIDLKGREVHMNQTVVTLTAKEFDIVELLALHPGQVFSKEQIYERIWGLEASGDASTVTEHIKKIRAKLGTYDPLNNYISTLWGVGYKWERSAS